MLRSIPVPVLLVRAGTPIEAKDLVAKAPRVRIAKLPAGIIRIWRSPGGS